MLLLRNETINYFVSTYNLSPDTCHCKLIFTYRLLQNKFLISFYHKVFLSILTAFPPPPPVTNHAVFICVNCKTTTVCKRNSLVMGGGGKHSSKTFSIFYVLNSKKQSFQPIFFKWYLSNEKTAFVDKSRVESTIFFSFYETFLWSLLWAILH